MREAPRQPKHLDVIDEESLAVIGRRLERWDRMKDPSIPIQQRIDVLLNEIEGETQGLQIEDLEAAEPDLQMLAEDISIARRLAETDEDTIKDICDDRIAEYREIREALIAQMRQA